MLFIIHNDFSVNSQHIQMLSNFMLAEQQRMLNSNMLLQKKNNGAYNSVDLGPK